MMNMVMASSRVLARHHQKLRCVSAYSSNALKVKEDKWGIVSLEKCGKITYHKKDYDQVVVNRTSVSYPVLTNSCNGLIAAYGVEGFQLMNPSIMKISNRIILDNNNPHDRLRQFGMEVAALGIDPSSSEEEYKLVGLFSREHRKYYTVKCGCVIVTLGGTNKNLSWKLADDAPDPYAEISPLVPPVYVNGVVYWTLTKMPHRKAKYRRRFPWLSTPEVAISFNLSEEKFSYLLQPTEWSGSFYVFELGGSVAVAAHIEWQMVIWTLKDHNKSIWEKLYAIDMRGINVREFRGILNQHSVPLVPMEVVEDGRKMIRKMILIANVLGGAVEYYDPIARRFVKHKNLNNNLHEREHNEKVLYTKGDAWPIA